MDLFNNIMVNSCDRQLLSTFEDNGSDNQKIINNDQQIQQQQQQQQQYKTNSTFTTRFHVYNNNNTNNNLTQTESNSSALPSTSSNDVLLPNIFVQIPIHSKDPQNHHNHHHHHHHQNQQIQHHSQQQQQQQQNNNNKSEIKSEQIKSESDNLAGTQSITLLINSTTNSTLASIDASTLVTARPKNLIKCHKCTICPFISISRAGLDRHIKSNHQNENCKLVNETYKRKLTCPGCDNVFYSEKSLKTHLSNDHQMTHLDIRVLLPTLLRRDRGSGENVDKNSCETLISPNVTPPPIESLPSQPLTLQTQSQQQEQQPYQLSSYNEFSSSPSMPECNNTKQKIYLKDVEVLKNPLFTSGSISLISDSDILYDNMNELDNTTNTQEMLNTIENYQENEMDYIDLIDDEYDDQDYGGGGGGGDSGADEMITDDIIQPSIIDLQNKIFVKNDNVLKDPAVTQYLTNHNANDYTVGGDFIYTQGGLNHHLVDTTHLYLNSEQIVNIVDTPPPICTTPQLNIYSHENKTFQSNFQNNSPETDTIINTKPISDIKQNSGKIFIKNVDILKKPIFLQQQYSTSNSLSPQPQIYFSPSSIANMTTAASTAGSTQLIDTLPLIPRTSATINQQKTIFIKNIDILKEPSLSQPNNMPSRFQIQEITITPPATNLPPSPQLDNNLLPKQLPSQLLVPPPLISPPNIEVRKNMLHLRTVDELNLLNINEVQNLIDNYHDEDLMCQNGGNNGNTFLHNEQQQESIDFNFLSHDYGSNVGGHDKNNLTLGSDEYHRSSVDAATDQQCLVSVIQDLVNNLQQPQEENDKYQFQLQLDNNFDNQNISEMNYTNNNSISAVNLFVTESNNISEEINNGNCCLNDNETINDGLMFENIVESTSSSMDEKTTTNKTEQNSRIGDNGTPLEISSIDTGGSYYGGGGGDERFIENYPRPSINTIDSVPVNRSDSEPNIFRNTDNIDKNSVATPIICSEELKNVDNCGIRVVNQQLMNNDDHIGVEEEDVIVMNYETSKNTNNQSIILDEIDNTVENDLNIQSKEQPPNKGRIYVVTNLMKTTTPPPPPPKLTPPENPLPNSDHSNVELNNSPSILTQINKIEINNIEKNSTHVTKQQKTKKNRPTGRRKIVASLIINPVNNNNINNNNQLVDDINSNTTLHSCSLDCAMQFKNATLLEYHQKCHNTGQNNQIICPDCKQDDFRSWNTLHTHLWRSHNIDMGLYSCNQCKFKTPILSRMINTHMRIHSDERNFKCEQCDKAFKNTKQLKNHRRIHTDVTVIQKCEHCDRFFYNQKNLRNHIRSVHDKRIELKCEICNSMFSSVKARETHMLNHTNAKKFKCTNCSYTSNDDNAYRRHRMIHDEKIMYSCPFCKYKSIQSTTYAKHIKKDHPDEAKDLVFSCEQCKFITVNKRKYELHVLNHDYGKSRILAVNESSSAVLQSTAVVTTTIQLVNNSVTDSIDQNKTSNNQSQIKIKVKSSSALTKINKQTNITS